MGEGEAGTRPRNFLRGLERLGLRGLVLLVLLVLLGRLAAAGRSRLRVLRLVLVLLGQAAEPDEQVGQLAEARLNFLRLSLLLERSLLAERQRGYSSPRCAL